MLHNHLSKHQPPTPIEESPSPDLEKAIRALSRDGLPCHARSQRMAGGGWWAMAQIGGPRDSRTCKIMVEAKTREEAERGCLGAARAILGQDGPR